MQTAGAGPVQLLRAPCRSKPDRSEAGAASRSGRRRGQRRQPRSRVLRAGSVDRSRPVPGQRRRAEEPTRAALTTTGPTAIRTCPAPRGGLGSTPYAVNPGGRERQRRATPKRCSRRGPGGGRAMGNTTVPSRGSNRSVRAGSNRFRERRRSRPDRSPKSGGVSKWRATRAATATPLPNTPGRFGGSLATAPAGTRARCPTYLSDARRDPHLPGDLRRTLLPYVVNPRGPGAATESDSEALLSTKSRGG